MQNKKCHCNVKMYNSWDISLFIHKQKVPLERKHHGSIFPVNFDKKYLASDMPQWLTEESEWTTEKDLSPITILPTPKSYIVSLDNQ